MTTRRVIIGSLFVVLGVLGFAVETWRFETIPDLQIRPESLAGDDWQTCGIEPEGTVICWGSEIATEFHYDNYGFFQRFGPLRVDGLDDAVAVAVAPLSACAARESGDVVCWGRVSPFGASASTGGVTEASRQDAVTDRSLFAITELSNIEQLIGSRTSMCARDTGGRIACNSNVRDGGSVSQFVALPQLDEAVGMHVGHSEVCALRADRSVVCTGIRANAEVRVVGRDIAWLAGSSSTMTGELACIGFDSGPPSCWRDGSPILTGMPAFDGASGVFDTMPRRCAIVESELQCTDNSDLASTKEGFETGIVAVQTGGSHSCASLVDGRVQCWGTNVGGSLGDASATQSSETPVVVAQRSVSPRLLWPAIFATSALIGAVTLLKERRSKDAPSTTPFDF